MQLFALLALASLGSALPLEPRQIPALAGLQCTAINAAITLARVQPSATAFCSSYLSIGTKTATAFSTSTSITTQTQTATSYSPSIVLAPTTTTTTVLTAQATSTSISIVFTTQTTTSTIVFQRRAPALPTPAVFAGLAGAALSSVRRQRLHSADSQACSCLSIASPTVTSTQQVVRTSTALATSTVKAVSLTTQPTTIVVSSATTTTQVVPSTSTSTVQATATALPAERQLAISTFNVCPTYSQSLTELRFGPFTGTPSPGANYLYCSYNFDGSAVCAYDVQGNHSGGNLGDCPARSFSRTDGNNCFTSCPTVRDDADKPLCRSQQAGNGWLLDADSASSDIESYGDYSTNNSLTLFCHYVSPGGDDADDCYYHGDTGALLFFSATRLSCPAQLQTRNDPRRCFSRTTASSDS